MSKKDFKGNGGELSTFLGADAELVGNLVVKNSARVDGKLKGAIKSENTITIGDSGTVEGDITGATIIVGGRVTGNLIASAGRIVLEASAVLTGNLRTVRLVIEEGAQFNGESSMGESHTPSPSYAPKKIVLDEKRVEEPKA